MVDFDVYVDWYRVGTAVAFFALDVYVFALFWWAWRRTRLWFLGFIVTLDAIYILLGAVRVVIAFAEERLRFNVFGVNGYVNFVHALYVIQPLLSAISVIGSTFLVRWVVHSHSSTTKQTI